MHHIELIDWFPRRDLGSPPFTFQGVSARVFPLPASFSRLEVLCQRLFNIAPKIAIFRPALPVVNLIIVNYGRMETKARSYGWVAQNEVAFTVPLECYLYYQGRYVFYDYTVSAPFIYVDSDSSLHTGRELYGWPKIKFWISPIEGAWSESPQRSQLEWSAATRVFRRDQEDPRHIVQTFLDARRDASWLDANAVAGDGFNVRRTFWGMFGRGSRIAGDFLSDSILSPASYQNIHSSGDLGLKAEALQRFILNRGNFLAVNLRQTRDTEDITRSSYQAISWAKMKTTRLNDGGLLGAGRALAGDVSGGYRVHIAHYDSQPIVSSLGLNASGRTEHGGVDVSIFEPWMPYWMDVDLEYGGPVDVISFVKGDTAWRSTLPNVQPPGQASTKSPEKAAPSSPLYEQKELPPFRKPRGGASPVLVGPYHFPECTSFVFPLRSRRVRLDEFCNNLEKRLFRGNKEFGLTLQPTPASDLGPEYSYVYMMLTNFEEISAPNNQIGWWASRQLSFFFNADILIDGERIMTVNFAPFVFKDSGLSLISSREFLGWQAQHGRFQAVKDLGLQPGFHPESRQLLHLQAEVAPTLFLGDQVAYRTLIRLVQPRLDATYSPPPIETLTEHLLQNHIYRTMGFKQTRDAQHLGQVVFQEITITPTRLRKIFEGPVPFSSCPYVVLKKYPTHPIFQQLGVITADRATKKAVRPFVQSSDTDFDVAMTLHPFWLRYERYEHSPTTLLWRSQAAPWTVGKDIANLASTLDLRTAIRRATSGNLETSYAI